MPLIGIVNNNDNNSMTVIVIYYWAIGRDTAREQTLQEYHRITSTTNRQWSAQYAYIIDTDNNSSNNNDNNNLFIIYRQSMCNQYTEYKYGWITNTS